MKEYKFLHYENTSRLGDVESLLSASYQDWEVVGISSNTHGLMILLVKEVKKK